jgi:hypothetical protein
MNMPVDRVTRHSVHATTDQGKQVVVPGFSAILQVQLHKLFLHRA